MSQSLASQITLDESIRCSNPNGVIYSGFVGFCQSGQNSRIFKYISRSKLQNLRTFESKLWHGWLMVSCIKSRSVPGKRLTLWPRINVVILLAYFISTLDLCW